MQLHARHALEVGCDQIEDCDRPQAVVQLRAFHHRARLKREHPLVGAGPAAMGHGAVLDVALNVHGTAARAIGAVRPARPRKPRFGGRVIREHLPELDQGQALTVSLAGCPIRLSNVTLL